MSKETDDETAETTEERKRAWSRTSRRTFLKGTGALAGSGALLSAPGKEIDGVVSAAPAFQQEEPPEEPSQGGQVREFTVHAIPVDIVYNRFGLHQPEEIGAMYVLEENLEAVEEASGEIPGDAFDQIADDDERVALAQGEVADVIEDADADEDAGVDTSIIEPLVIRANEGDMVEITFVNDLDRQASIHQTALPYDVKESDGMAVGFNPDTTVAPGGSITYRWFASQQGGHFFYDGANPAYDSADEPPEEANLLSRNLFGTMVVEPPGATWTDPETGEELLSGVRADIHDPGFMNQSYREFIIHYHTPEGVETADGGELSYPIEEEGGLTDDPGDQDNTPTPQMIHAINYRADPTGNRVNEECPDCDLEEFFYNSWTNGDPGGGDNVYATYKGDPIKFVAVGASLEEHHVHHLHAHRWKRIPNRIDSDTIDSQTLGLGSTFEAFFTIGAGEPTGSPVQGSETSLRPGLTFEESFSVGAGYTHGFAGDVLFHCHLFPHYGEGMWALMRVNDKEQDDLVPLPETEIVDDPDPDDLPLLSGQIIGADSDVPGFPDFIPNEVGTVPPVSPLSTGEDPLETGREPTAEEELALGDIVPGAPYADPADPERLGLELDGVDAEALDDADADGDLDLDDVEVREYRIHAIAGDIVYNDDGEHDPDGKFYVLEEDAEAARNGDLNPEPLFIRANVGEAVQLTVVNELETPVSIHPHFVGFDILGSDSLATGFNYDQATPAGEERQYRWFCDEEGAIYFHDHIAGIDEGMHGLFCSLIVEPPDAEYFDPYSGEPIEAGSQAIIQRANGPDFRELCLHYHDFAQLVNRDGEFINPRIQHNENAGTFAINLRNAPYYQRNDPDPAYVHSSAVHGDPPTGLFEAYANDPVRIRLLQGSWEEQHNFDLHGREIDSEGLDLQDTVSEIIGTSEAFTFFIDPENAESGRLDFERLDNPFGLGVQDYIYGSNIVDDLFTGMWGLHRVFSEEVPHLQPLPDRGAPGGEAITEDDLRRMGHPGPFIGFDRLAELGRKAFLLYDEDDDEDDRMFPPDKDARQNENVGEIPPLAPDPGDPCPADAPVRSFDVTAFQTDIDFNEYGDHDPFGIVFALDEWVEDIQAGRRPAEPLGLRANQGDCIEVNLTNALPQGDLGDLAERLRDLLRDLRDEGVDDDAIDDVEDAIEDVLDDGDFEDVLEELFDRDDGDDGDDEDTDDGARSETTDDDEDEDDEEAEDADDEDTDEAIADLHEALDDLFGDLREVDLDDDVEELLREIQRLIVALVQQIVDVAAFDNDHAHPQMRVSRPWDRSNRISLHPQRIQYDVNGSDGATAGFNFDQTIPPGETITYRWFAEEPLDNIVLWDHADIRSNRHHGAFGGLIIEPPDATWVTSDTAEPQPAGVEGGTMVSRPGLPDQREFSTALSDGRYIINRDEPDSCVVPANADDPDQDPDDPCNQIGDPAEDQGFLAINNRCEPFIRRFETGSDDQHLVFSSEEHGDPATAVYNAFLSDPVKFLVHQTADKTRGLDFHLAGHQWRRFRGIEESPIIGVDDRFSPGKAARLDLISNAGGVANATGDYIYMGDTKERRKLESGIWGIFRVGDDADDFQVPVQPLPDRAVELGVTLDDRDGWTVARGDMTGDGTDDLAIGVPESDIADPDAGAVYWFEGPVDEASITHLADADVLFYGETGDHAGKRVEMRNVTGKGTGGDKSHGNTETDDLVVWTDGEKMVVPGGKPLNELLDNPPKTMLSQFVDNTTNNSIDVVASLRAVVTDVEEIDDDGDEEAKGDEDEDDKGGDKSEKKGEDDHDEKGNDADEDGGDEKDDHAGDDHDDDGEDGHEDDDHSGGDESEDESSDGQASEDSGLISHDEEDIGRAHGTVHEIEESVKDLTGGDS